MGKKIFPCVRCAESTFRKKIAYKLKEYGYVLKMNVNWEVDCLVCTNAFCKERDVSNLPEDCLKIPGRYLCRTIPEFLAATKALAIEQGWFKEEKREVKKWPCVKCTMPDYYELIRRQVMELGWYVKVQSCYIDGDIIIHTNCMEQKRYIGPSSEMADGDYLCPDIDTFLYDCREIAIREGWFKTKPDTEEVEEEQTEPTTPTLAEARRQFRELTQHYTVEELSKNEPPRSWIEYRGLYPVADERTAEAKKKAAALGKLVLLRDEWRNGWNPDNADKWWSIRRECGRIKVSLFVEIRSCISFQTRETAEDFLNTFRDLIEEAGDLI